MFRKLEAQTHLLIHTSTHAHMVLPSGHFLGGFLSSSRHQGSCRTAATSTLAGSIATSTHNSGQRHITRAHTHAANPKRHAAKQPKIHRRRLTPARPSPGRDMPCRSVPSPHCRGRLPHRRHPRGVPKPMRDPARREGLAPRSGEPACPSVWSLASASGSLHHRRRPERNAATADAIIGHGEADEPGSMVRREDVARSEKAPARAEPSLRQRCRLLRPPPHRGAMDREARCAMDFGTRERGRALVGFLHRFFYPRGISRSTEESPASASAWVTEESPWSRPRAAT